MVIFVKHKMNTVLTEQCIKAMNFIYKRINIKNYTSQQQEDILKVMLLWKPYETYCVLTLAMCVPSFM